MCNKYTKQMEDHITLLQIIHPGRIHAVRTSIWYKASQCEHIQNTRIKKSKGFKTLYLIAKFIVKFNKNMWVNIGIFLYTCRYQVFPSAPNSWSPHIHCPHRTSSVHKTRQGCSGYSGTADGPSQPQMILWDYALHQLR